MQLVGVGCSVCNETIRFAPDAAGCPSCRQAFHKACCKTSGLCPRCGGDFASANDAQEKASSAQIDAEVARGRRLVIRCSTALLLLQLLGILGALAIDGDLFLREAGRFLVLSLVLAAVYLKFAAARVFLMIVLVLNVALSVLVLVGGLWDARPLEVVVGSLLTLVVYGASLYFLSSDAARLYFARQREVT